MVNYKANDIAVLTSGGPHSWIMINALRERFGEFPVIEEQEEPSSVFWRRRRKMLGSLTVAGQVGAMALAKLTKPMARARVSEIIYDHNLKFEPELDQLRLKVSSVNSEKCQDLLRAIGPKAVFVVSTRILSRKTLRAIDAPFINYHSGVNPAYRGINGGYYALAKGDPERFGATVHLIDEGVDTGATLYTNRVPVTKRDNLHTYLWLLAANSQQIVVRAMEDALTGNLRPVEADMPSKQYFAPTIWEYLWYGARRGVW